MYRTENDSVGSMSIPTTAYYGVNAARAQANFQITGQRLEPDFIRSLAEIKKAAALANAELGMIRVDVAHAIVAGANEVLLGLLHDQFIVDPMQGGAGTSSNMNINEVLANRAIELLGGKKGDYTRVSPNDDVNRGQSTNDVYPTAGKLTLLKKIPLLHAQLERMALVLLQKAEQFKAVKKIGRTQLSDAVPLTLGQEFHAYYSLVKRHIKRLAQAKSEILTLNMGGTAIGTGISAHPRFSATFMPIIRELTGEELELADDLIDATQNVECYAVIADVLKVIAISLSKIANDIRLLSSGPRSGIGELIMPVKQNGSSIMPGKINPVIPEIVNQCAFIVAGNSVTVAMAVEGGQLELNAFEPVIFYKLFESFDVLEAAVKTFVDNCLSGIEANEPRCHELLERSLYLSTKLAETVGYAVASDLTKEAVASGKTLKEVAAAKGIETDMFDAVPLG
ncbi:aspartate ammonia-lyase [Brochothrix campestris]|uniref:aspartate ammonia-lyase n=1 Tax=Brochothrix campestris TaxID=2757 RepID=UPI0038D1D7B6